MKTAKKTKAPQRRTELDQIAAKVRTALRNQTKNVIEIGNLLIESRKHLDHGEWQPWLVENFDLSLRTAQNYCAAAEYVARAQSKSATVADITNLSAAVLYQLAGGHHSEREEAAILAEARERRVDQDAAWAICDALAPPDSEKPESDGVDEVVVAPAEDPEITAILDGPPPAVPPPAPIPPPSNFALRDFDQAISALKQIMTKPAARFASTAHPTTDLENVESFIHAVADRARAQARADRAAEADVEANES